MNTPIFINKKIIYVGLLKLGFLDKLKQSLSKTRRRISNNLQFEGEAQRFDESFFEELEETMILADVGVNSATEIVNRLKHQVKLKKLKFKHELKNELVEILIDLLKVENGYFESFDGRPRVVLLLGVNGVGKTTTIAKLAHYLKSKNRSVVLAAGDTYRAAAVEQLNIWAQRVDCPLISHGQDCDPASVVFDSVSYSSPKNLSSSTSSRTSSVASSIYFVIILE